jgi:hypothetical protein
VQRILDLDLDAFVHGTAHFRDSDAPRLDPAEFPAWELSQVIAFLAGRCLLDGPCPGFAIEHHGELFFRWRDTIDNGLLAPPFHVTHVDAHADLGLGDASYMHLLTELVHAPVDERHNPKLGSSGLGDGNYLAFAIANRWISDLHYVVGGRHDDLDENTQDPWRPGDLLVYLFEDFDPDTRTIRLPALDADNLRENLLSTDQLRPLALEPPVRFSWEAIHRFQAPEPFDLVCLARSPGFTPETADALYAEIRARFIEKRATRR